METPLALLIILGLMLATLEGANEPQGPTERTPWYEYDGAFRGIVG